MFQCAYRFNSYIALAVAGMLFGSPGIATMGLIVGAAVPVVNLVSVWMLARHGEVGLLREVARNPLIWGPPPAFCSIWRASCRLHPCRHFSGGWLMPPLRLA
jgi:predicted permease